MTALLVPADFREITAPLRVEAALPGEPGSHHLAVESVRVLPAHRLRAEPFVVVLRGPATPLLPQATYTISHPRLGPLDVFLVPVGVDAAGARYEAMFN